MNDDPTEPEPQDFAALLLQHARGRSHDELSNALGEVVRAVATTGKAGSITYTIKVAPAKNVEGMVKIEDTIKATVPQLDRAASIWFAGPDGRLSQDHPNQQAIFSIQGDKR